MQQTILELMEKWEVFKEDREIYCKRVYSKSFAKGQRIASGEDECRGLVLIEYGALRAYIISSYAKEINLFVLHKDDYCILSASCMFKNITFEVNLEFIETSRVWILPSKVFDQLSLKYPKAKQFHLDLVSQRLSKVVDSLSSLAFESLNQRVFNFLLESLKANGNDKKRLYITHGEIANALGSAREAVSRVLKDLEKQNKIILKRGIIEFLD